MNDITTLYDLLRSVAGTHEATKVNITIHGSGPDTLRRAVLLGTEPCTVDHEKRNTLIGRILNEMVALGLEGDASASGNNILLKLDAPS